MVSYLLRCNKQPRESEAVLLLYITLYIVRENKGGGAVNEVLEMEVIIANLFSKIIAVRIEEELSNT